MNLYQVRSAQAKKASLCLNLERNATDYDRIYDISSVERHFPKGATNILPFLPSFPSGGTQTGFKVVPSLVALCRALLAISAKLPHLTIE